MRYKITASGRTRGVTYVDADSLEAAEEQIRKIRDTDFDWNVGVEHLSVEKVELLSADADAPVQSAEPAPEPEEPYAPEPDPEPEEAIPEPEPEPDEPEEADVAPKHKVHKRKKK